MIEEKEVNSMKIQSTTNNKQTFGMAWSVNKAGMTAQDLNMLSKNTHFLNAVFSNFDVKISKRYHDQLSKADTYPINKFFSWFCSKKDVKFVFNMTNSNKSSLEKLKSFFGLGIKVKAMSKGVSNLNDKALNNEFMKSALGARNKYAKDEKVLAKRAKETKKS